MRRYTQEYRRALMDAVKSGLSAPTRCMGARRSDVHSPRLVQGGRSPGGARNGAPGGAEPFDALPLFTQFKFPGKKWFFVKASEDTYHEDVPGFPAYLITRRPRADRLVVRTEPQLPNIPPPAARWIDRGARCRRSHSWRTAANDATGLRGRNCRPTFRRITILRCRAAKWMKAKPV